MTDARDRNGLTLYSDAGDLHSHRARLLLAEKGLLGRIQVVSLAPDQVDEDLLVLNPSHELPTLVDRNLVISDFRVMIEYLEERYPVPGLLPGDPVERANVRMAAFRIGLNFDQPIDRLGSARAARRELRDNLSVLAGAMNRKKYLLGNDYSAPDVMLAPLLWRLPVWKIKPDACGPGLLAYARRLFARPAFETSLSESERLQGWS